jgi:hypothetical protein
LRRLGPTPDTVGPAGLSQAGRPGPEPVFECSNLDLPYPGPFPKFQENHGQERCFKLKGLDIFFLQKPLTLSKLRLSKPRNPPPRHQNQPLWPMYPLRHPRNPIKAVHPLAMSASSSHWQWSTTSPHCPVARGNSLRPAALTFVPVISISWEVPHQECRGQCAHLREDADTTDHRGSFPQEGDRQAPCAVPFGRACCTCHRPRDGAAQVTKVHSHQPKSAMPSCARAEGGHWEGPLASFGSEGEGVY